MSIRKPKRSIYRWLLCRKQKRKNRRRRRKRRKAENDVAPSSKKVKLEVAHPSQKCDRPMSSSQQVTHKVVTVSDAKPSNLQVPSTNDTYTDKFLNGNRLAGKCISTISSPESLMDNKGNITMLSDGQKNSESDSESECSEMELCLSVYSDSDSYSWNEHRRKEYKSSSILDPHAKRTKRAKERQRIRKEIIKLKRRLENGIHLSRCQRSKAMKHLRLLQRKRSGCRTKCAAKKRNESSRK